MKPSAIDKITPNLLLDIMLESCGISQLVFTYSDSDVQLRFAVSQVKEMLDNHAPLKAKYRTCGPNIFNDSTFKIALNLNTDFSK